MKWLYIVMISVAAWGAMPISQVQATTVVSLSDESLAAMADYIVHGVIASVEPVRVDQTILTRVTLRVEHWLKPGNTDEPAVFVFYTRGGVVGDTAVTIPGEMQPVIGTEVVVFLERIHRFNDVPMLLGLLQGAFFVEPPIMSMPDGKQPRRISQHLENLHIYRTEGVQNSDFAQSKSLDELLGKIRKTLENAP